MNKNNLILERTAKSTEVLLAYFLHEKVYPNEILYIGDGNGKFPDIHTADGSIGIEVVQAEFAEDFASNMIWKKYDEFKGNARKLKSYIKAKLSNFDTTLFIKNNKVEAWSTTLSGHSAYYSKHIFERAMNKKLGKLNDGHYASITGEINLGIVSIFRAKPDRIIKDIQEKYLYLKQYYKLNFNKIFVLFTDAFFEISENGIKKHKISNDELEELKINFKKLKPQK